MDALTNVVAWAMLDWTVAVRDVSHAPASI